MTMDRMRSNGQLVEDCRHRIVGWITVKPLWSKNARAGHTIVNDWRLIATLGSRMSSAEHCVFTFPVTEVSFESPLTYVMQVRLMAGLQLCIELKAASGTTGRPKSAARRDACGSVSSISRETLKLYSSDTCVLTVLKARSR